MVMNSNELDKKLKDLYLQEKVLKKVLDTVYNDSNKRTKTFNQIKKVKKEIDFVKFKIKLERKMNNENNNTY